LNLTYLTEAVDRVDFMNYIENPQNSLNTTTHDVLHKIDYNFQTQKMNNNRLFAYLKDQGYRIEVLEGLSQHYSGITFKNADFVFSYQDVNQSDLSGALTNAYYLELIGSSMLSPFNSFFQIDKSRNVNYTATRYILHYLETGGSKSPGPKFTYAHIMCPHVPYVFDRSGKYIEGPSAESQRSDGYVTAQNTVNAAYLDQYIFITNEIARIAGKMVKQQPQGGSVIFIQSDHGPRPHEVYLKNRENSFRVLNAIYFPDHDYEGFYDSISPINSLRLMLNKYFHAGLEKVEDN